MISGSVRNPWLDVLRAAAIMLVVIHHTTQAWPGFDPSWLPYTRIGAKGVDLFFVLSGWLIGGIFWRELHTTGDVQLMRFWKRRWIRTIPPYMAGLLLAWLAVKLWRDENFDWGYLLFLQNYYQVMPFFLVSWSLCIEEHFYLMAPVIFRLAKRWVHVVAPVSILLPALFRYLEFPGTIEGFGYFVVATHLYIDPLLIGFYFAHLYVSGQLLLQQYYKAFYMLAGACLGLLIADLPAHLEYVIDPLCYALLFVSILLLVVERPRLESSLVRLLAWIATISYSIYLTHALVIHAHVLFVHPLLSQLGWLSLLIEISMILSAAWAFHLVFEESSIRFRERVVPAC